jgi:hypothetical protein
MNPVAAEDTPFRRSSCKRRAAPDPDFISRSEMTTMLYPENHARAIRRKVDDCPGVYAMAPEFYLILKDTELRDELADAVFEAGFDDSELTMRGDRVAIWVCHRPGQLTELVREALAQARSAQLEVSHVEIENAVFA